MIFSSPLIPKSTQAYYLDTESFGDRDNTAIKLLEYGIGHDIMNTESKLNITF